MYNFLIDSHCHLTTLEEEKNMKAEDVVKNAQDNGIKIINNIATSEDEFERVLQTSKRFDNVYASIGVHPSNIGRDFCKLDKLIEYSKSEKVIGIGETGFEYFCEPIVDKNKQKKNLEIHIEACRKTNLPLIIHTRNADEDMIDILKSEMKNGEFKFLLHCFSSGKELCWTALDLGGFISLSGIVTFKNANDLRNIIRDIPLNKIMLETDSPFLAPAPFRGKINEPAYVKNIVEYLVDFLKKDFNIIQENTTRNFFSLFSKAKLIN